MDIEAALQNDRTVDITTIGRRSGEPRRIEIWAHQLGPSTYISGTPGRRGWYANLLDHPEFVVHLTHGVKADLAARARPVTDPTERERVLRELLPGLGRADDLDEWLADSPIVEVRFDGDERTRAD
jgi:deazaflavin-dependent oxidoreductase (nitroreductase family)